MRRIHGNDSWANLKAISQLSSWTHERALREKNKSLRVIFEEANMEYGQDAETEADLTERQLRAMNLRKESVQEIFKKMRAAKNLDLCFMVDVTSSMRDHIQAVKDQIHAIVTKLTATTENTPSAAGHSTVFAPIVKKIRLAFVGYRDFDNERQFEVLNFCDSVADFHAFCAPIKVISNKDNAEDVFGGLEKTIALNWSTDGSTRILFHIADAPCHGKEYHNYKNVKEDDSYPDGDPMGRSIHYLLGELAKKNIIYHFGKITKQTNKMIEKFSKIYGHEIGVCNIKDASHLFSAITSTTSIAVAKVNGLSTRLRRFAAGLVYEKTMPNWKKVLKIAGVFLTYELPNSMDDIFSGVPLEQKQPSKAIVQLAPKPFAKGVERVAYYGRDVTSADNPIDIVLKKRVCSTGFLNSSLHYEGAIQVQTIAAYMAATFTATSLDKVGHGYAIKFLKGQIFSYESTTGQVYMSCERLYPVGCDFLRFSNNFDYSMLEETAKEKGVDLKFVEQLMAFSHWTYQISRGYLMVVDLQGIVSTDSTGNKSIQLTDPAIHCTDLTRFGHTNLGLTGMKSFFSRHICNEFCTKMGLTTPTNFGDEDEDD